MESGDLVCPVPNPRMLDVYLTGALALQAKGANLITTTCGFLIPWQDQIAAALDVPFVSSSLMQIPLMHRLVGGRVAILTADAASLTTPYLRAAGVGPEMPIAVRGLQGSAAFTRSVMAGAGAVDFEQVQADLVELALRVLEEAPDTRAFVLECHNLPPYAAGVRERTGLPVFDIVSAVSYVGLGRSRPPFGARA